MENQAKQRIRKSPEQQIQEAKDALRRAHQRQRQMDTRSKIVIGSLAQAWLFKNEQAGRAFSGYLRSIEIRDQDREVIDSFAQELAQHAQTLPKPPGG